MEPITKEEALVKIQSYLKSESDYNLPFFVFVDSQDDYEEILGKLHYDRISTSDYCARPDVWPDLGRLSEAALNIQTKTVLVGLGAVAMLGGPDPLPYFRDLPIPEAGKLVVLCRGARRQLFETRRADPKFDSRRFCLVGVLQNDCRVVNVASEAAFQALKSEKKYGSFKELLKALEDGASGRLYVSTDLYIENSSQIATVRDALCETDARYRRIPEDAIDEIAWEQLAKGLSEDEEYDDLDWRRYVELLLNSSDNAYLQLVMKKAPNYRTYRRRYFNAILEIDSYDKNYASLYKLRKELLSDLDDDSLENGTIAYLSDARAEWGKNAAPYLTDLTQEEKRDLIALIAESQKIPHNLATIYPDLNDYFAPFSFTGCQNPGELSHYFDEYRRCKVFNKFSKEILDLVEKYARPDDSGQIFSHAFPSRAQVLDKLDDGTRYLYWLDALGIEYLGFIKQLAFKYGMRINVKVARCILPSETRINRGFYDKWQTRSTKDPNEQSNPNKWEDKRLDKLIHKQDPEESGTARDDAPIYLAKALEIIQKVVKSISNLLHSDERSVVLVSDHGSTRGQAINYKTVKTWACANDGEEGGRIVLSSTEDTMPDCATEGENGYWSMANYDRFKGGNLQGYEAHGGATLEEVLVPVIEFKLSEDAVDIRVLSKEVKKGRHNAPAILELETSRPVSSLELIYGDHTFYGEKISGRQFKFELSGLRTGPYEFECQEENNPIGVVSVEIIGGGGNYDRSSMDFFND